ncbi:MAG TPA: SbcC/MukB-like Walker B domain-containing protein [Luteibacter sp.]|nr:SbcC/MukB-like Walker B domain-containing protein [Luteibacter sp.]
MFLLKRVHLVQFFLFQAETLELDATTAIIAPNGAGKSALLDALQIVMLGGDRNQIRFNAQAGGSARARSIRDYCLGVYRAGDEGRARETASTYISLVFEEQTTGETLTAGIALGASAQEPDHRVHGLYLLSGVPLTLDDHLETIKGQQWPLEWSRFKELIARRCKDAGTRAELHNGGERFVKDMLLRLRPGPTAYLDPVAYRKAFQNALNLQRVTDVDLFVRTLVAEDRPTEIGKFRTLLDGFRMIKEKIEQVARRIEEAENVERGYRLVSRHATRAASYRALKASYDLEQHGSAVGQAEDALENARDQHARIGRELKQAHSDRETAEGEYEQVNRQLQGTAGYQDQASFEQLIGRDKNELGKIVRQLLHSAGATRDALQSVSRLEGLAIDASLLTTVAAPWQSLYTSLSQATPEADMPGEPSALHDTLQRSLEQAQPVIQAARQYEYERRTAHEAARDRANTARMNQLRVAAGQAELRPDVSRLVDYLAHEGIVATPVCDLVQVSDASWQPAIEAYLRSHLDALLIPVEHEQRAVRLYRSLQGGRAVYGVKLALTSQARQGRGGPEPSGDLVSTFIEGRNPDAVAYLRKQLGELRCIESEEEVVRARHGLSRDGLVVKGGGVERRRLPAVTELKIGASQHRDRLRQLRDEFEGAEQEARALEAQLKVASDVVRKLMPLEDAEAIARGVHGQMLAHREAVGRYRSQLRKQTEQTSPDLLRLAEEATALRDRRKALEELSIKLTREDALAESAVTTAQAMLTALKANDAEVARLAREAAAHPDVDPSIVDTHRQELDDREADIDERIKRCVDRARDNDHAINQHLPAAWAGLSQYAKDQGLTLTLEAADWRAAIALLEREIGHLKNTELVEHQAAAEEAYATAIHTFRSNVAAALYDNFHRLQAQIQTLNRTLRQSPAFSNDERYHFRYEVAPEYRELHRFIEKVADVGETDTLFGSAGEVPAVFRDIIEDKVGPRGQIIPSPLDDYRRFFSFEVNIRQGETVIGTLSERMRSGSGGEHRAPLYVIAGAALAAAYGKRAGQSGGLGVIMLDEFGDKIDAQNARATTNYLRSLGLQLILAAPDTAQGTLTGVLDSYIELFRDGPLLQIERTVVTEAGRQLLESDQFAVHPDLLEREIARMNEAKAADDPRQTGT